jgi:hypothetical protein
MIRIDEELRAAQERILLFERTLAEARKTYSASNYKAMAEGHLRQIDSLQAGIREYLSTVANPSEAA